MRYNIYAYVFDTILFIFILGTVYITRAHRAITKRITCVLSISTFIKGDICVAL